MLEVCCAACMTTMPCVSAELTHQTDILRCQTTKSDDMLAELNVAKGKMAMQQSDLSELHSQLMSCEAQLSTVCAELSQTQDEVKDAQAELTDCQAECAGLRSQLHGSELANKEVTAEIERLRQLDQESTAVKESMQKLDQETGDCQVKAQCTMLFIFTMVLPAAMFLTHCRLSVTWLYWHAVLFHVITAERCPQQN